jgi:hypothetical protein
MVEVESGAAPSRLREADVGEDIPDPGAVIKSAATP